MKNGINYPADWNDNEIKDELKTIADRIKKYKPGESDYLTENLIDDAFNYNFGSTELQNRKTNRFSRLVVLIAIVTLFVAAATACLAYVTYKSGNDAQKAQNDNIAIMSSIDERLKDIANDVEGIRDALDSAASDPESSNTEQTTPLLNKT